MQNYAILIDGGFAKRKLGTAKDPANAAAFLRLVDHLKACQALCDMRLHRVYYYDSVPLETTHKKPLGGELNDFGKSPIVMRSRELFRQLASQPFTALRLGELSFEGWEVNQKILNKVPGEMFSLRSEDLKAKCPKKVSTCALEWTSPR